MKTKNDLETLLQRIDGKGYKAYKDIRGTYNYNDFLLSIDYVQGDPFASPSKIRIIMNHGETGIPIESITSKEKKRAFSDYIARQVSKALYSSYERGKGSGKSGRVTIDAPGQEVLDRTAIYLDNKKVEVRLEIGLPAAGRRVLGRQAIMMLVKQLPDIIPPVLMYENMNKPKLKGWMNLAEDQRFIRDYIKENGYVAFIANGAVLPRESGISSKPMKKDVSSFKSPKSSQITITLPHKGIISGCGIKEGVTLIVGGGYHGKSTLLEALELGVYDHIEGDGREYCITRSDAVKIRAEDGRSVKNVDITPFITNLPNKIETNHFSTDNASGSTSQAANIIEALEIGTGLLLIDEDTSATNFMIRDVRMQQLVHKDKEPITPFIDRVKQLYEDQGVSTILVIGGSGDYFDVADHVIMMEDYEPHDVTSAAKEIASEFEASREVVQQSFNNSRKPRYIQAKTFMSHERKEKIKVNGLHTILYNRNEIALDYIEQLIDMSQTRTIAAVLKYLKESQCYQGKTFEECLDHLVELMEHNGLESIVDTTGHPGNLAYVRKQELGAAINRWRNLSVKRNDRSNVYY